jgi:hypothetical protein
MSGALSNGYSAWQAGAIRAFRQFGHIVDDLAAIDVK